MNDPGLVRGLQGVRGRLEQRGGARRGERALLPDEVAQSTPVDQLHHDVRQGDAVHDLLARVEHRHDVRVVEPPGVLRLAAETFAETLVARHLRAQHLHGDLAAEQRVFRREDLRHAARTDARPESVAINGVGH